LETNFTTEEVEKAGFHPSGAGGFSWPRPALACPYAFALLGRFHAHSAAGPWPQLASRRLQQIVAYLLLFRERPHHRDVLSSTLWAGSSTKHSRKNLRQSLWHVQRTQGEDNVPPTSLLLIDRDWVQVDLSVVWLDVAQLESAFDRIRLKAPEDMTEADAAAASGAVGLYRGDLLEGWDEAWCVQERDRMKGIYLSLLERLVGYCEATYRLDDGLAYGDLLLRHDRAHERGHWRVMRLHHLAGNRTGALRQFEMCRTALDEELGVGPGHLTRSLYEEICTSG
jgi:DNA-binding SARP family transcriptional activator